MVERILVRNAVESEWFVFTKPIDVLLTRNSAQVLDVLTEVERRVNEENLFAAGFLSYEAASGFDPAFVTHKGDRLPLICFGLFSEVQRVDGLTQPGGEAQESLLWQISKSRSDYIEDLSAIKRQIELGNTYQINYTVRERAVNVAEPWELFLRSAADAPYAAYIECTDHVIVSASPELFFQLNDEQLISKPMKGTAPRGLTSVDDPVLGQRLFESHKNRAENVMIVDMVRNDLGRIASPGTVAVPSLFALEKYPTVWQMTSTVSASTKATVTEIFSAMFPSASITGAPKVASMAIIAELEDTRREIYTGAIGFMAPDRQAQFSVAIRTALVDKKTNEAVYGVGGGIVWDSDPDEEYKECLSKARILSTSSFVDFELLETMLWIPEDGFFLLDKHLSRLGASAAYFDFEFDRVLIEEALADVAQRLPPQRHRIRLVMHRDGQVQITETPVLAISEEVPHQVSLACEPIDTNSPFIYHKTTRREVYDRALQSAGDGGDVLLWNEGGYITESSIANVIVRIDGKRYTPPVECGLLAGTYRELLLQNSEISERKIHVSELTSVSEVTLINSVRGEYSARLCSASMSEQYSNSHGRVERPTIAQRGINLAGRAN
jgi:para-aminobenzoate synthetase/4-amino-4-deoxychorismate lyase